jgi:SagB-type dehydrogenase family enzyme
MVTGRAEASAGIASIRLEVNRERSIQPHGPDSLEVTHEGGRLTLKLLAPSTRAALLKLAEQPMTWDELSALVGDEPTDIGVHRLALELNRLLGRSLLVLRCRDRDGDVLVVRSVSALAALEFPLPEVSQPVQLSRFPALRRVGSQLVIDSPLGSFRIELARPAIAALLATATTPCQLTELADAVGDPSWVDPAVRLLMATGVLSSVDASGRIAEDSDPTLMQRTYGDVMFHTRSRLGLNGEPMGAQYLFDGQLPPTPAIRPPTTLPRIDLPGLADTKDTTRPGTGFWDVVGARRSIRAYGRQPLTVAQLGEFLYRVARVDSVIPADRSIGLLSDMTMRPYPSGGNCHDLELYLTVRTCSGVPAGLYRYLPMEHALERLPAAARHCEALLRDAYGSNGSRVVPQVLITITSRFSRVSWKYAGMAYALTLKNAGVLIEFMYLAATEMRLAPCALGNGNSATFALATGLDIAEESAVAELMLGSHPDS